MTRPFVTKLYNTYICKSIVFILYHFMEDKINVDDGGIIMGV